MSILFRTYPGDDWGFLIAIVLLQVTVVILAAWLLSQLGSRWNPALRHTVYLIALACVLASPVLSCLMQATGIALVTLRTAAPDAPRVESPDVSIIPSGESSLTEIPAPPQATTNRVHPEAVDLGHGLRPENLPAPHVAFSDVLRAIGGGTLVIWVLGVALLVARWCYGLDLTAALRREAQPLDCSAMTELLRHVRQALGTDRLPQVATSTGVDRPIMVGLIRPLVILPENVVRTLDQSELADVLVHECAHAVCRHQVVGLLQRAAGVLFWPHPLVHLLNRELARAREEVCDNFVLRRNDARRYARTLLDLSQSLSGLSPKPMALGLFHNPWSLEDRVAGLLDRRRKTMIRINRSTATALTAVLLLPTLLIAGTKVLEAAPIEQRSINKSVKEFPEKTDLSTPESAMAALSRSEARADIQAALELLWVKPDAKKAAALREVIENCLALDKNFGQKILDSEVIKVLTYCDDLAAVIFTSSLLPRERPYGVVLFGRINGKWKNLDWQNGEDLLPSLEEAEKRFAAEKEDRWHSFVQVRNDVENGRTPIMARDEGGKDRSAPWLPSAKQMEEIVRVQAETWQLEIHLDMPSLEPQAVQYTVLDKDPVPDYIAQIKRMQKFSRQQLEKADTGAWKDLVRVAQMKVDWDNGFKHVTGENLHLLTNRQGTVMSSNRPDGKKWLVTKTTGDTKGRPVCWCIPVEVEIGKRVDVTFSKSNTFDLQTPYDNVMKEPAGIGDEEESK